MSGIKLSRVRLRLVAGQYIIILTSLRLRLTGQPNVEAFYCSIVWREKKTNQTIIECVAVVAALTFTVSRSISSRQWSRCGSTQCTWSVKLITKFNEFTTQNVILETAYFAIHLLRMQITKFVRVHSSGAVFVGWIADALSTSNNPLNTERKMVVDSFLFFRNKIGRIHCFAGNVRITDL